MTAVAVKTTGRGKDRRSHAITKAIIEQGLADAEKRFGFRLLTRIDATI